MTFLNAHKGVTRIFFGEILEVIGEAPALIALFIAVFAVLGADNAAGQYDGVNAIVVVATTITVIGTIIALIANVFKIVGVITAGKDQRAFKIALVGIILEIILSIALLFVSEISTLDAIFTTARDIAGLVSTFFIIQGIRNLAIELEDEIMEIKGDNLFKLYFILVLLTTSVHFAEKMFSNDVGMVITMILNLVSIILLVVQYALYLSYLSKAKKMLLKEKPADDDEEEAE